MTAPRSAALRLDHAAAEPLLADFAAIRSELGLPGEFPADALETAARAASTPTADGREDLRALPFVTVDPAGSLDLDQALLIEPDGDGFLLRYAIADVGAFVRPGDAVDREAWRRGVTLYAPDVRLPLYPTELSEGAASLLPDRDRPAVVFTHRLGPAGERRSTTVTRALVRSRRRLSYEQAAEPGVVPLLDRLGTALLRVERQRGALRVDAPEQEVVRRDGGFDLRLEARLPVEDWNAQLSLLTGIAAAELMLRHGVGLLRTMAAPDPTRLEAVRGAAAAVDVAWPDGLALPELLRRLDRVDPREATVLEAVRHAMGRARYVTVAEAGPEVEHAAIAAPYAHVTAPLRRLADRYVLDLLCELAAGRPPAAELRATLDRLPTRMNEAEALEGRYERAVVDAVEARVLEPRVGQVFAAVALAARRSGATIQLPEPPVRTTLQSDPPPAPGTALRVRLAAVDVAHRTVTFERV